MYLPLTTVTGVHLSGVRERLLACTTLAQVCHFPREDLFRESQEKKKAVTVVTAFFLAGETSSNMNTNTNV